MKRNKIVVLVGPTSSGKSALAVELARRFDGEIISADSRQVYTGLDIGTGKVTKKEMRGVPHHLLDACAPKRVFTAHQFIEQADAAIRDIASRGKLPIVVGGTGFYADALTGRIVLPNVPANQKLRARLQKKSAQQLFALLQKRDAERAKALSTPSERNNKVRLIRALEVAGSSQRAASKRPQYDVLWIGLAPRSAAELEKRIKTRLSARLKQGMIAEALRLHRAGLSFKRMRELGLEYAYLANFLQKKVSRTVFEEQLYRAIRKYARRQITYWKRNDSIHWYDPSDAARIEKALRSWLK